MANRFSDIAKQMGAKIDEETEGENKQKTVQNESFLTETTNEISSSSKPAEEAQKTQVQENEVPMTRKTTALPLVLDIAIKEVKERRNIASKIKKSKKITEDDVVIEALELYFKKAENKSYLNSAYEKLKNLQ